MSAPAAAPPFLPANYRPRATTGHTALAMGPNELRLVTPAIVGVEFWETRPDQSRHPVRQPPDEPIDRARIGIDPKTNKTGRVKDFWAAVVWNPGTRALEVLTVTQVGIRRGLEALLAQPAWGNPLAPPGYSVIITKTAKAAGSGGEDLSYTVTPLPKAPLPAELAAFVAEYAPRIDLTAIYRDDDPFAELGGRAPVLPEPRPGQPAPDGLGETGTIDLLLADAGERIATRHGKPVTVWGFADAQGRRYGTTDPAIGERLTALAGGRPLRRLRIEWVATPAGRQVLAVSEAPPPDPAPPPNAAPSAAPAEDDEAIPF